MNPSDDQSRRLIEASAWRVHLTEIGEESSAEFEAWLFADTRNLDAWQRVEAPWDFVGEHASEPEIVAARSAALGLPRFGRTPSRQTFSWPRVAAANLLLIAGVSGALYWWLQPTDYQTALGERRTLTLADGSRLSLDSNSEVRVAYSGAERRLELVHGQARFEVVHDAARPFLVEAGGATVRATGTDFDIDLLAHGVVVALINGGVAVSDADNRIALKAGEQLTLARGRPPQIVQANPADVVAWLGGQVVFHNAPLSVVVERLNRYDQAQIILADPRLDQLRVSGTFNTGDAVAIADVLTRYLAIKAVYSGNGIIELRL